MGILLQHFLLSLSYTDASQTGLGTHLLEIVAFRIWSGSFVDEHIIFLEMLAVQLVVIYSQ